MFPDSSSRQLLRCSCSCSSCSRRLLDRLLCSLMLVAQTLDSCGQGTLVLARTTEQIGIRFDSYGFGSRSQICAREWLWLGILWNGSCRILSINVGNERIRSSLLLLPGHYRSGVQFLLDRRSGVCGRCCCKDGLFERSIVVLRELILCKRVLKARGEWDWCINGCRYIRCDWCWQTASCRW